MKVKDLLKAIKDGKKEYPDFLEWDVYTEQLNEKDKEYKRKPCSPKPLVTIREIMKSKKYGQGWEFIKDEEGWEYFKCYGFNTTMPEKKIFTVNVNF